MSSLTRELVRAEERLRARGLTGVQAFDVLVEAVAARLGMEGAVPTAFGREVAADLPLDPGQDLLGLAFERFFPDLFKGLRGQYFTPRPVVRLLLSQLDLPAGSRVLDPTCGAGGLLVEAARRGWGVQGLELDPQLARLARLNLALAGFPTTIEHVDCFRWTGGLFDAVIANPPFSVPITDPAVLGRYPDAVSGRMRVLSDHLFLDALRNWVRPGGHAGVVLPWTVLANDSTRSVRERLVEHWSVRAVCALPEGVFRPFGGAAGRAGLLWLQRRPAPSQTARFASLLDPGYDVGSTHLRRTSTLELDGLCSGEGWQQLPDGAWLPSLARAGGTVVASLATVSSESVAVARLPATQVAMVELADVDKVTGEVARVRRVASGDVRGSKLRLMPGDVLYSRLRPSLNSVAVMPTTEHMALGSTEWLPLRGARWPHALCLALRTPSFRSQLPITGGQTRPRTTAETVLRMSVALPGPALTERVDRLAAELTELRRRLRHQLAALEAVMDAYARGALDEQALDKAVTQIEEESSP